MALSEQKIRTWLRFIKHHTTGHRGITVPATNFLELEPVHNSELQQVHTGQIFFKGGKKFDLSFASLTGSAIYGQTEVVLGSKSGFLYYFDCSSVARLVSFVLLPLKGPSKRVG